MKPFLISAILVCGTVVSLNAAIHTVSNNPNRPAQYDNITAAIAAASAGDTIYIHGSQFNYPDFTITKRLVVVGAGYNSNNQFALATRVGTITLTRTVSVENASGSSISGFHANAIVPTGALPVTDITITRNRIDSQVRTSSGSVKCSDWLIYNNIILQLYLGNDGSGPTFTSATNILVQNNIITGFIIDGSSASILVDHNLFVNAGLGTMYYATISNNFFVRSSGTIFSSNVSFCTFNNNFSNLSTITTVAPGTSFLNGNNTGSGNISPAANPFISVADIASFSLIGNYRVLAGSAADNGATDGSDIGIYGGTYPFPSGGAPGSGFDTSALPPIPQITDFNIQNATIQPASSLNVNVKARINN
jgi:hypothetical protein